ncbi:MAG: tyrosine--tRNA ligase [Candidatus Eisenbacteria bacterium]
METFPKHLSAEDQFEILSRGVEDSLPQGGLLARLKTSVAEGRPLRVKQGFDPTAPDIHLGHTVGLRKLRDFQALGHQVVLIVGDYTGMVGDPSGRSKTRPQLTTEQVESNATTYLEQFHRVLLREPGAGLLPVEVHRNGDWFSRMTFMEIMHLASHYTVARMLERDDFHKRFRENQPISIHEMFYPLMQGYDSVAIRADIEMGGTEQKFNLIVGRALQEIHGQPQQVVLTVPLLPGLDGKQRMSKSLGNYIGVTDAPAEMFGKVMSIPDEAMLQYWRLATDVTNAELRAIELELSDAAINPMGIKKRLGQQLVRQYHGESQATQAQSDFETQFSKRGIPDDLVEVRLPAGELVLHALLVQAGLAKSGGDARRAVSTEHSVEVDGARIDDPMHSIRLAQPLVLRRGRRMVRVVPLHD